MAERGQTWLVAAQQGTPPIIAGGRL